MNDELDKIATPRGEGRAMQQLSPSTVDMSYSNSHGEGADWMGPRQPMAPLAPPQIAGRQFDYQVGYNLSTQPRAFEEISFASLRSLAESFDPVRIIIERRKDQLTRLPWCIRPKHEGGKRPMSAQLLSSQMRGIIRDVTAFFKRPEESLSFRQWVRALIEDVLVTDAVSIYSSRDPAGNLIALEYIDGATVRPIIGDDGRPPKPFRWNGEPFNWLGQPVTGADFDRLGIRIVNGLVYLPAYQQVLKGLPAVNYTTWDLYYRPLNLRPGHAGYGHSPVAQIAMTISIACRRALHQLEYYREGNMPEGVFGLPENWVPDQVARFQDYWDSLLAGNLGRRRQIRFVAGDGKLQPFKEPVLKSEMDEFLIRIVCAAFSYPPSAFVSLSNRSIAESHEKQAEEEGLEPLKNWFSDLANDVIEREFSEELEFSWLESSDVDPIIQSRVLSRYVEGGILSRNEARLRLGEAADPNPNANRLMVTTAGGIVPVDSDTAIAPIDDDEAATKSTKGQQQ